MAEILQMFIEPNEMLTKIIVLLVCPIEFYVTLLIITTILNITPTRKQKVLYIAYKYILGALFIFFLPSNIKAFTCIAVEFISILLIFKCTKTKTLLSIMATFICTAISEAIVIVFIAIIHKEPLLIFDIPIARFICLLLIYSIELLLYKLISTFKDKINILENLPKKTKIFLLLNFIFGILAIAPNIILMMEIINDSSIIIYIYLLSSMLIFFCISLYTTFKSNELEATKIDLENSKLYNKSLSLLMDNLRVFKHDYNNVIQAIGGFLYSDKIDDLRDYYKKILKDCESANSLTTLNPEIINNPAIFGLIGSKYHIANSKDVKINLTVLMDLTIISTDIYKLTKILGILLDNAIEAASLCENKYVNIILREDGNHKKQLFIIENTYTNKDVDIGKVFEKDFSTKETKSGLGLWEVSNIVIKNKKLFLDTFKTNELFRQQLEINI